MPPMKATPPAESWPVVAAYQSSDADLRADMTMALLAGSDIPAVRLPVQPMSTLARGCLGMIQPVRVLVPPEYQQAAEELLAEEDEGEETSPETV